MRKAPVGSQNGKPYITTSLNISDPSITVRQSLDKDARALRIETPNHASVNGAHRPCISLVVTAWLPDETLFSQIEIFAVQLGLRVLDDVRVKVTDTVNLQFVSGDVHFPQLDGSQSQTIHSLTAHGASIDVESQEGEKLNAKYPVDSRRIIIKTVSGDIDGGFPLYDYLELDTTSGTITVSVVPEDILPSAPAPAELSIRSISGDVQVTSPIQSSASKLYARNYRTTIHTNSGSLRGSYIFGSLGSFTTTSADIDVTVLPVILLAAEDTREEPNPSLEANRFSTSTISGTTKVNALEPVILVSGAALDGNPSLAPFHPLEPKIPFADHRGNPSNFAPIADGDPYQHYHPPSASPSDSSVIKARAFRSLQSLHHTTSAYVEVHYPSSWEGYIHAHALSGQIQVEGEGVQIVKNKNGVVNRELIARKGVEREENGSQAELRSISGDLHILVGN